jgi:branched-chain amino acid transport system ATP-binding protein
MQALRIISEDHTNLWRLATTIDKIADEIAGGAAVDTQLFQSIFDYLEHFVDAFHHPKEDDFLFRLLRLRSVEAHVLLDSLQQEHREGPDSLRLLRARAAEVALGRHTAQAFAADLHGYTEVLKSHIRTEEKYLMPMARAALTVDDWSEIDGAFLNNQDPLFGETAKAEFRELFHRIASLAPESLGLGSQSAGHLNSTPAKHRADVLLRVTNMESCYGRIKALKGLSLEVRRGETVALVGANGAGKTTFLRTLSGVQPMSAGSIEFEGEDISKLRADLRMRRGICQSPEGRQVFGPLSIDDNLRLGAYTQPKQHLAEDLDKVFAMFPILNEKRKLPAGTLSGGQQQMLAIARALMGRPKMLLLDEPSMGLAPLLVEEVFHVVKSLKAQGMTILLVEQNAFAALGLADRGYVLETGNVTLSGTGQELISNEQVRAAYLGM